MASKLSAISRSFLSFQRSSMKRPITSILWYSRVFHIQQANPFLFPSHSTTIHNVGRTSRMFGSKRGIPWNPPGTISIYNDQTALPDIDEQALKETIQNISTILGYETYDVTLLLVEDDEMQETNLETLGIDAPTDILSFPFHFHTKPGLLEEPEFDIPDYYTLGDMMISVPYVIRRCQEDQEESSFGSTSLASGTDVAKEKIDVDEGIEMDDRGVSGAMANVHDPEKRIQMLLIHGMLHLVGYDHKQDDEYLEMVGKEEEILKSLGYT